MLRRAFLSFGWQSSANEMVKNRKKMKRKVDGEEDIVGEGLRWIDVQN